MGKEKKIKPQDDKAVDKAAAVQKYDAATITVLEGVDAVRKRPAMYIGDTTQRGLHHLVYEIVYNSVDEAMAGYCNHITVIIKKDNSVSVEDNGRGFPVETHPTTGKSALETALTFGRAPGFATFFSLTPEETELFSSLE